MNFRRNESLLSLLLFLCGKETGEGNGTPLQYSCPENPRDGGAWWVAVYGVAQSRTRLTRLSSSSKETIPFLFSGSQCNFAVIINHGEQHDYHMSCRS